MYKKGMYEILKYHLNYLINKVISQLISPARHPRMPPRPLRASTRTTMMIR